MELSEKPNLAINIPNSPQLSEDLSRSPEQQSSNSSTKSLACIESRIWDQEGDLTIHLSVGGLPHLSCSYRVSTATLRSKQCGPLLHLISQGLSPEHLYLTAPYRTTQSDVCQWLFATRNFLAWICDRPLRGSFLGKSLLDLLEQMNIYRDSNADNIEDLLFYADLVGYTSIDNHPDYAIAMLFFAESIRHRLVWIDSFAHCVGMSDQILENVYYKNLSTTTKSLLIKTSRDIKNTVDQARKGLENFLEDETSASSLGLGQDARGYLESFRSALHSYYATKFGAWPPNKPTAEYKRVVLAMFQDFSRLYQLIVDKESSETTQTSESVNGGLCVLQIVENFNFRHRYTPLPCSMPILPRKYGSKSSIASQKSITSIWSPPRENRAVRNDRNKACLLVAINHDDLSILSNDLVQRFLRFETQAMAEYEEKLAPTEARKICWIFIYSILQTLTSITKSPPEVRETNKAEYWTCFDASDIVPWEKKNNPVASPLSQGLITRQSKPLYQDESIVPSSSQIFSIEPDCQRDDYFEKHCRPTNSITGSTSSDSVNSTVKLVRKASLRGILRLPTLSAKRNIPQRSYSLGTAPRRRRRPTISDMPERGSLLVAESPLGGFEYTNDTPSASDKTAVASPSWPLPDFPLPTQTPLCISDSSEGPPRSVIQSQAILDHPENDSVPPDDPPFSQADSGSAPSLTWSTQSQPHSPSSDSPSSSITSNFTLTHHDRRSSSISTISYRPHGATFDSYEAGGRGAFGIPEIQDASVALWRSSTTTASGFNSLGTDEKSSTVFRWRLPYHETEKCLKVQPGRYQLSAPSQQGKRCGEEEEDGLNEHLAGKYQLMAIK